MGGFWISEKLTYETVFYTCFSVFYLDPESDRIKLALLRIIAGFWGEVSRPVFSSPGMSFEIFTMLSFLGKQINKAFLEIYIDDSAEKNASFSDKSRPKLNRGNWSVSTIFQTAILKKRQTVLHASRKMAGGTAGPIRLFSCSNTPAKVLKHRFPETKTSLP